MSSIPPRTGVIRRTLLYGAAFGLLVGLGGVAVSGAEGREAIALWRNAILAGAALGLAAGLIRAARQRNPNP